ncbi:MAG: tetratricopeptide repeat protein [Bacteroidia bacterium]
MNITFRTFVKRLLLPVMFIILIALPVHSEKLDNSAQKPEFSNVDELNGLSAGLRKQNLLDSSYKVATLAMQQSEESQYTRGKADAAFNLAQYYLIKSLIDKSIHQVRIARGFYEEQGDLSGIAKCEMHLGLVYFNQKKFKDAEYFFSKGIAGSAANDVQTATLHYLSGLCFSETGNFNQAESHLLKAQQFFKDSGIPKRLLESEVGLADLYLKSGKYDEAESYYSKALSGFRSHQDELEGISKCVYGLSLVYKQKGQVNQAIQKAEEAFEISYARGFFLVSEPAAKMLSTLYLQKGDFARAYVYQEKYYGIRDSILSADNLKAVLSIQSELQLSKKQTEIELLQKQKQISRITIYSSIGGGVLFLLPLKAFKEEIPRIILALSAEGAVS